MSADRKYVQCLSPAGFHKMAYREWGAPSNPKVLICVHGVTRVGDDFDELARHFSGEYRVICPDVVGRGYSDRLRNPAFYVLPQYVSDMVTLLARSGAQSVDWIGTSMGGLIGMGLAALEGNPIRQLVLNDVGPTLNPEAIARIGSYIGQDTQFADFEAGLAYIKAVSASFGPHTDAQWRKLARDVLRENEDGSWRKHYDLGLAEPFKATTPEMAVAGQAALWAAYDAIRARTLLIRGELSDLLSRETALEMGRRGPQAQLAEIAGVGHAPTLQDAAQIQLIQDFLSAYGK